MFTLNCKGKLLVLDKPAIMGILNITPDSFYAGSRFVEIESILSEAAKMLEDGADILDIGGQSTRPGSTALTSNEEADRVLPTIQLLHKHFPDAIISIDTYHAAVASAALEAGASMVNDISGGHLDPQMIKTVATWNVPFVCMHMKGNPANMQEHANYQHLTVEVLDYFIQAVDRCRQAGIRDIIIDPGFGFSKTIHHNFRLLKELEALHTLSCPILAGLSRKSTIYKTLGISPEEALNGTTVMNTIALQKGVHILRVHDVKEAKQAIQLLLAFQEA